MVRALPCNCTLAVSGLRVRKGWSFLGSGTWVLHLAVSDPVLLGAQSFDQAVTGSNHMKGGP